MPESAASIPLDWPKENENCVFVAKYIDNDHALITFGSLPQRMSNEQLAYAIISTFRPFGTIVSVKASRDKRGRPFGFIEFAEPCGASAALSAAPFLFINYRNLRLEPAKSQRKLSLRIPFAKIDSGESLAEKVVHVKKLLSTSVPEGNLKISLDSLGGAMSINAVVKLDNKEQACPVLEIVSKNDGWEVNWLYTDKSGAFPDGANIRSSGLVHIVPSAMSGLPYPSHCSIPFVIHHSMCDPTIALAPQRIAQTPPCEEEIFACTNGDFSCTEALADLPAKILASTIFVGRLNSRKVTRDLLVEHFQTHGAIRYICLFNRQAVSSEGVPLDAYAFITYKNMEAVNTAIDAENGNIWLGQTVKCEPARVLPATATVIQLYHMNNAPIPN